MLNKRKVLIFGANSFLAKDFFQTKQNDYECINVYRSSPEIGGFFCDFLNTNKLEELCNGLPSSIDAILFFQGIIPSVSARHMNLGHFQEMLKVNLITPTLIIKLLEKKINQGALILFFSSNARTKGSYDPSYGAAKAGIVGLVNSLVMAYSNFRFNIISLGLVKGSPVDENMTEDFRIKHKQLMFNNELIDASAVTKAIVLLLDNTNFNRADIQLDGGLR